MMGIYDKLLEIIANPFRNFKRNLIYLLPMGIGALISLVLFVLLFSYLFEAYEKATYLLFTGLIAGNLPVIFKKTNRARMKLHHIVGMAAAFAIALAIGILSARTPLAQQSAISVNLIYLALCGVVAGISSIVPGISVSMILIMFGVYDYLIKAARSLDILVIAIVGVCFVCAMVGFSHFVKFIFRRYNHFAYCMVFGFMCGSLLSIFLSLPASNLNFNWFIGALAISAGLGISLLFPILGRKFNVADSA